MDEAQQQWCMELTNVNVTDLTYYLSIRHDAAKRAHGPKNLNRFPNLTNGRPVHFSRSLPATSFSFVLPVVSQHHRCLPSPPNLPPPPPPPLSPPDDAAVLRSRYQSTPRRFFHTSLPTYRTTSVLSRGVVAVQRPRPCGWASHLTSTAPPLYSWFSYKALLRNTRRRRSSHPLHPLRPAERAIRPLPPRRCIPEAIASWRPPPPAHPATGTTMRRPPERRRRPT
jgi:hypothetical protein